MFCSSCDLQCARQHVTVSFLLLSPTLKLQSFLLKSKRSSGSVDMMLDVLSA